MKSLSDLNEVTGYLLKTFGSVNRLYHLSLVMLYYWAIDTSSGYCQSIGFQEMELSLIGLRNAGKTSLVNVIANLSYITNKLYSLIQWGIPRIELRTSRTQSENHTARPNVLKLTLEHTMLLKPDNRIPQRTDNYTAVQVDF
ncbi:hypothetical protein LOK49_LG10G00879 [Camellia lanceoleosa]|uniref:Uncharacterized protein n=1 Tax=Camellia lanceoleosa TaxID=1840588 RepID=A0ACC0G623_9ERIC|nr:hypothetical protein LOK49_LG10G00879 [Camellia lanceoleosa]